MDIKKWNKLQIEVLQELNIDMNYLNMNFYGTLLCDLKENTPDKDIKECAIKILNAYKEISKKQLKEGGNNEN